MARTHTLALAFAALVAGGCTACSSSSDGTDGSGGAGGTSTGGSGGSGGKATGGDAGDDAGAPAECHGPGYASDPAAIPFSGLTASVVDVSGKGVTPGTIAQACGINICLNGETASGGRVIITEKNSLTKPAFKYGGGQNYARFALPLSPEPGQQLELGDQTTIAFDAPEKGAALQAGKTATSRTVSVTLATNAVVTVDPFDFETDDLKKFRAAVIPEESWPDAVDGTLDFDMVVALTPSDAVICPAAKLSLENTEHLPAGKVEIYVHGVDITEEWAPYGGWAKVSDGHVTDDLATIETDPEGGLPVLSVIGIRVAK
jgi:hypothetical protein